MIFYNSSLPAGLSVGFFINPKEGLLAIEAAPAPYLGLEGRVGYEPSVGNGLIFMSIFFSSRGLAISRVGFDRLGFISSVFKGLAGALLETKGFWVSDGFEFKLAKVGSGLFFDPYKLSLLAFRLSS